MTAADWTVRAMEALGVSAEEQSNPSPLVRLIFNRLEKVYLEATAEEREACASVAEMMAAGAEDARSDGSRKAGMFGRRIAASIRARSTAAVESGPPT